jgi:hypothetical protein
LKQLNWVAWQEILAQVFDGFEIEKDISPEWLTNPTTGRRLKLDRLYPEVGLAVRFVGGRATGQRRRSSDQEVEQEQERDRIRDSLCTQVGLTLLSVDADDPEPWGVLGRVCVALGGASRRLAMSDRPSRVKVRLMPQLAAARERCHDVRGRLRDPQAMELFVDLWRDREAREVSLAQAGARQKRPTAKARRYREGQAVRHVFHGDGTVLSVNKVEDDVEVAVLFLDGSERRFLGSLVPDKLLPND